MEGMAGYAAQNEDVGTLGAWDVEIRYSGGSVSFLVSRDVSLVFGIMLALRLRLHSQVGERRKIRPIHSEAWRTSMCKKSH